MSGGPPGGRPNILILMADQMHHDMIGAHGPPVLRTPHLDRLVREGVSLRKAYTESPVCVPARAAFLTGRLPHRSGVFDNHTPLTPGTPTFPRLLAESGSFTQAIGKMHFEPVREGHGFRRLWLSEEIPGSVEEDDFRWNLLAAGFGHMEEPHGLRHELYYMPQPSQLPEHLDGPEDGGVPARAGGKGSAVPLLHFLYQAAPALRPARPVVPAVHPARHARPGAARARVRLGHDLHHAPAPLQMDPARLQPATRADHPGVLRRLRLPYRRLGGRDTGRPRRTRPRRGHPGGLSGRPRGIPGRPRRLRQARLPRRGGADSCGRALARRAPDRNRDLRPGRPGGPGAHAAGRSWS